MTTTMQCPSCGREQQDGILCSDCCCAVETMIAAVPQLVEQLNVAISRQAKVGGGGKGGLARERAPINFGALAVRDALQVEAAYVGQDINWLRRHVQAAEMVRDFGMAVRAAYRAIDRAQEREYLGKCGMYDEGHEEARCEAELWSRPKAEKIECPDCKYVHDVASRRFDLLGMAADMLVTVREASSYVGSYGNLVVTESTIRSYLSKGQISYHGKIDGVGTFRLGDLLVIIAEHARRKGGRPMRRVSA